MNSLLILYVLLLGIAIPSFSRAADVTKTATFAGGCFWCMEKPFEKLPGVISVESGYTGGVKENPAYEEVSAGVTGHAESIQVTYNPAKITYSELLDVFWKQIDPTDAGGQFVDRGTQYRSEIFYHTDEQKQLAEKSKEALEKSGVFDSPILTRITPASKFYKAEEYHQDYYSKNPIRYKYYRNGSGRDQFLEKVWKDNGRQKADLPRWPKPELKKKLTPLQYEVTQENGTEPPFQNEYWDNKGEGIYVDIVSNEPLFSSKDKFDSGTGWPSFSKPLEPANIVEKKDRSFFSDRTEVRSKQADSHLGHVFDDGPPPTGLRYCMNSAALRFIPKGELKKEGFTQYEKLFEN